MMVMVRLIEEYGTPFCGRGWRQSRWTCPENGAGLVGEAWCNAAGCRLRRTGRRTRDGRQGHDPGGTIDADGMPLPNEPHAATNRMIRNLRGQHPASGCVPSPWGPTGQGVPWGAACAVTGCPGNTGCHKQMCRGIRFAWLVVMSARDMTASALRRAVARGNEAGRRSSAALSAY